MRGDGDHRHPVRERGRQQRRVDDWRQSRMLLDSERRCGVDRVRRGDERSGAGDDPVHRCAEHGRSVAPCAAGGERSTRGDHAGRQGRAAPEPSSSTACAAHASDYADASVSDANTTGANPSDANATNAGASDAHTAGAHTANARATAACTASARSAASARAARVGRARREGVRSDGHLSRGHVHGRAPYRADYGANEHQRWQLQ
jgi:hypothetical protein